MFIHMYVCMHIFTVIFCQYLAFAVSFAMLPAACCCITLYETLFLLSLELLCVKSQFSNLQTVRNIRKAICVLSFARSVGRSVGRSLARLFTRRLLTYSIAPPQCSVSALEERRRFFLYFFFFRKT